jgi:ribosomal subunit interface protein
MNVNIQAPSFTVTPGIEQRIRARFGTTLQRHGDAVIGADIYLRDINGPKGGDDKLVTVRVRLRNQPDITIENTDEDLYRAIDRAAKRANRALRRSIRKQSRLARNELRWMRRRKETEPQPT